MCSSGDVQLQFPVDLHGFVPHAYPQASPHPTAAVGVQAISVPTNTTPVQLPMQTQAECGKLQMLHEICRYTVLNMYMYIFLTVVQRRKRGMARVILCDISMHASDTCVYITYNYTDGKPDLTALQKFPHPSGVINIMQQVVPQYKLLGNILLKDPNGVRVEAIELDNPHHVNNVVYSIFQKWLVEDTDATWGKLVQCLDCVNLCPLAQGINSCLM